MLRITDAFHPWAGLLQPYGRPPDQVPAKTGSLAGVSTLAGFLPAPPGSRRTFVIILNQERNTRDAVFRALMGEYGEDAAMAR
jgi:D-alanyl-D-alanine carboxypeptidase